MVLLAASLFACASAGFAPQQNQSWTIAIGGDVMLNQIAPSARPLRAIAQTLKAADFAIVNLEIPLTNARTATQRKTPEDVRARKQFILKADPRHFSALIGAGIDVVSLGNNHGMDYGPAGLKEELGLLDGGRIGHAGAGLDYARAWKPARVTRAGQSISLTSFLSFLSTGGNRTCWPAEGSKPGIAALMLNGQVDPSARQRIASIVRQSRSAAGFCAIAIHGGIERQTLPTPYQVALARAFIDAGADLVIGHHPHVLQGAEVYRGKPIFYSMGNLVSPVPAKSALAIARWSGKAFQDCQWAPYGISGGRTVAFSPTIALREFARFQGLCDALRRRYPSPYSSPMRLSNLALKSPSK